MYSIIDFDDYILRRNELGKLPMRKEWIILELSRMLLGKIFLSDGSNDIENTYYYDITNFLQQNKLYSESLGIKYIGTLDSYSSNINIILTHFLKNRTNTDNILNYTDILFESELVTEQFIITIWRKNSGVMISVRLYNGLEI